MFCKVGVIMGLIFVKGVKKIYMIIKCAQCGEKNVMPKKLEPDVDYVCAKCKSVIYSKDTDVTP
jgi:formylmethanofuran dehydrogenase subunit E